MKQEGRFAAPSNKVRLADIRACDHRIDVVFSMSIESSPALPLKPPGAKRRAFARRS